MPSSSSTSEPTTIEAPMTSARRRAGASATPATSARMASTGRRQRERSSSRTAVWALPRLSLWSTTNWAFTAGIRSAKGTPFSTSTGLIAAMNAARLTDTWPLVTDTAGTGVLARQGGDEAGVGLAVGGDPGVLEGARRDEVAHLALGEAVDRVGDRLGEGRQLHGQVLGDTLHARPGRDGVEGLGGQLLDLELLEHGVGDPP